ncbi:MAG: hypothetical protein GX117_03245 [Candidatus Hydrogenedentes bacterium]|nr:hypothetical protein [Candidatus Hydrogenedentota bacterium]
MSTDLGYTDYREVLALPERYKPADVIRNYKKSIKQLRIEISENEQADDLRDHYLLLIAQLNVAFYILRDRQRGEEYLQQREELIALEETWRSVAATGSMEEQDRARRSYDQSLRNFLAKYMEEYLLEAGRDPDCMEHSGWNSVYERLAGRVFRQYRQQRYHEIHERLPYFEVSTPTIDWEQRADFVATLLEGITDDE